MRCALVWLTMVVACTQTPSPEVAVGVATDADRSFERIAQEFIASYPAYVPVDATQLGDHRFDEQLDQVSFEAMVKVLEFYNATLAELEAIATIELSDANLVDYHVLRNRLRYLVFRTVTLREWAWNPVIYTNLAGGSLYSLLSREFAPLSERLGSVASRLEEMPRLLAQVRAILEPASVPRVHAETAAKQNPGLLSIMETMIAPQLASQTPELRARLEAAMAGARQAVESHQKWLTDELIPNAGGEFRIGTELFDAKLAFVLQTNLSRQEIKTRAEDEYTRVRAEMYALAVHVLERSLPAEPAAELQQRTIAEALEKAYVHIPKRDEVVAVAKKYLEETTDFVREHDLVTLPGDAIEVILMPEFQRGVAIAYCDPPGPLDVGQKTFYAVAPLPEDWTDEEVRSFLREYNLLSIQDLTIHEAMPGHFLQFTHANRYPSPLRALLWSGPFVEGWAVYAERVMIDEGYGDGDPLMKLINLKWYLRVITNALMDQAIHVDGMTRDQAMKLMVEGGFQEEREAAGKWTRAQLTSAQLSTYFVGYQEHVDLRHAAEKAWGDGFSLKRYHDAVLSFGSPPVQFVRALVLGESIPH